MIHYSVMNTSIVEPTVATRLTGEGRLSYDDVMQYYHEGFCLLPNALTPEQLELLRRNCQKSIDKIHEAFDRRGVDEKGIDRRGARYFPNHPSLIFPEIFDFIHSDVMVDAVRKLLGPDVYVFHEQYVVKMAASDSTFAWHQDSGYVGREHDPYLTCWVALDDVVPENGPVHLLPYSRYRQSMEPIEHWTRPSPKGGNERVGYEGDDPGDMVTCPAGTIAFFSSRTLHSSGANTSDLIRRVYLIQYAKEILKKERGECVIRHGRVVGERKHQPDRPIVNWDSPDRP